MLLPQNTTVVVTDGTKLTLFKNTGTADAISLQALPSDVSAFESAGSGGRHHNSAANPSDSQLAEDDFAAGVALLINSQVESGDIKKLVLIAAPRSLGEIRKHYSKQTSDAIVSEISKDLTGHTTSQIEQALQNAA